MASLSSHLGGSGAPAPARAGSGRPAHTNDNDDDDTRAPHADAADPTNTPAADAAALSSLHDAKHRVAFARSVSRDASALSSRPTRVDPDTLPRRKYSGERERPPMPQQTHMMTTTYHDDDDDDDDDDDGPSAGERPASSEGAASDAPSSVEPRSRWRPPGRPTRVTSAARAEPLATTKRLVGHDIASQPTEIRTKFKLPDSPSPREERQPLIDTRR